MQADGEQVVIQQPWDGDGEGVVLSVVVGAKLHDLAVVDAPVITEPVGAGLEICPACDHQWTAAAELGPVAGIDVAQVGPALQVVPWIDLLHVDEPAGFMAEVGHQHLHGLQVLVKASGLQHVVEIVARTLHQTTQQGGQ